MDMGQAVHAWLRFIQIYRHTCTMPLCMGPPDLGKPVNITAQAAERLEILDEWPKP